MSHALYDLQWQQAVDKLRHLADVETPEELLAASLKKPSPDAEPVPPKTLDIPRAEAFDRFALLYLRYLQIFRDIEESYDQMVHPQKRRDIKEALDVVMVRLLQLRRKCIQLGPYPGACWSYVSMDRPAAQLQLSLAADLELVVPKYFLEEDLVDEERLELLEQIFAEQARSGQPAKTPSLSTPGHAQLQLALVLTLAQATQMVCKMERARQAVQRAKVLERLKGDQPLKALRDEKLSKLDESTAAVTIQRVYKGHRVRQQLQDQALEELLFLGMSLPNRLQPTR